MIPNKKIYRDVNGKQFNMFLNQTLSRNWLRDTWRNIIYQHLHLEHDESTTGVFTKEIWIVEDEKKDKQNLYGLNHPKGTWMEMKKDQTTTRFGME